MSDLPVQYSSARPLSFLSFLLLIALAAFAGGCTALVISGSGGAARPVFPWPVSPDLDADLAILEAQACTLGSETRRRLCPAREARVPADASARPPHRS